MAFLYIFESRSINPTIMLSPVPNIHLFAVFPKAHRNKLKTENTSNSFWSSIVYSLINDDTRRNSKLIKQNR